MRTRTGLLAGLLIGVLLVTISTARLTPAAQGSTKEPPTPTPPRYAIERGDRRVLPLDIPDIGIGAIGVDAQGNVFVGDSRNTVYVLTPDLKDAWQFTATQPYAVVVNSRGEVYVAQRNQAIITVFDRSGKFLRNLWSRSAAIIDTMALGPDDSLYVGWQTINPPRAGWLTRLSLDGQPISSRVLGDVGEVESSILSISPSRNIPLISATASGFALTVSPNLASYREYSLEGVPIVNQPALVFLGGTITAPAIAVRLRNDSMTLYANDVVGWFAPDRQPLAFASSYAFREGVPNRPDTARRSAIALRPDGYSVVIADVAFDGLLVGILKYTDRGR